MKANLCLLILICAYTTLYAQTKMGIQPLSAGIEQRKALLIGNRNYTHFRPLANTERDVEAMASLLQKMNFAVTVYRNLDYKGTVQAIANFKASLRPNDIALVYYSGHGIGSGGQSYLLPVESDIQCTSELEAYGPLSLNALVTGLAARQVRNSFVFLDACRNLPISNCDRTKGKDEVRGLVFPRNNPKGNLIVFATGEGETADDDKYDKTNSLFTAELIKHLGTPNLGIREIMDNVIEGVETRSGGKQVPQKLEDLRGNFVFVITAITLEAPRLAPEKNIAVIPPTKKNDTFESVTNAKKTGATIVLKNIRFERSKSDLLDLGRRELDRVAEWLKKNPEVLIELLGHTTSEGPQDNNVLMSFLSLSRVNECKMYLVSKGINENRIKTSGYGPIHPLASQNPTDKVLNRRVEMKIL